MNQVECLHCFFQFDSDDEPQTEDGSIFCPQCENRFVGTEIADPAKRLDHKNIRRNSRTATVLVFVGITLFLIGLVFVLFVQFQIAFWLVIVGIPLFCFGKLLGLVSDIRWFTKISAEREFRAQKSRVDAPLTTRQSDTERG